MYLHVALVTRLSQTLLSYKINGVALRSPELLKNLKMLMNKEFIHILFLLSSNLYRAAFP